MAAHCSVPGAFLLAVHTTIQHGCGVGWRQEECRDWDVNEIVFSPAMWPVYHGLMRADFTLFDEYEHAHAGARYAQSL